LIDADQDAAVAAAVEVLQTFPDRYSGYWGVGMHAKLGLTDGGPDDGRLVDDLLTLLRDQGVDYTTFFRALSAAVRGDVDPARSLFGEPAAFDAWAQRWQARLSGEPGPTAAAMDRVNPFYVPRNQRVEEALTAATAGDLGPVRRLLDVLTRPFEERPGLEAYATPAPAGCGVYRTFCGT
jgi:serine/tyrosine/threonine adenylyltransferase